MDSAAHGVLFGTVGSHRTREQAPSPDPPPGAQVSLCEAAAPMPRHPPRSRASGCFPAPTLAGRMPREPDSGKPAAPQKSPGNSEESSELSVIQTLRRGQPRAATPCHPIASGDAGSLARAVPFRVDACGGFSAVPAVGIPQPLLGPAFLAEGGPSGCSRLCRPLLPPRVGPDAVCFIGPDISLAFLKTFPPSVCLEAGSGQGSANASWPAPGLGHLRKRGPYSFFCSSARASGTYLQGGRWAPDLARAACALLPLLPRRQHRSLSHRHALQTFLPLPPLQAALAEPARLACHSADVNGIVKGRDLPGPQGCLGFESCRCQRLLMGAHGHRPSGRTAPCLTAPTPRPAAGHGVPSPFSVPASQAKSTPAWKFGFICLLAKLSTLSDYWPCDLLFQE